MLMLLLSLALAPAGSPLAPTSSQKLDAFIAQAQFQALYEEIAEAIMHATPADQGVEALRSVLYTPDWEFIDASGQHQSWQQASAASASAAHAIPFDVIRHAIQKLAITGDEATVVVKITVETEQAKVDVSATKMPHPRDQTMTFRDKWVRSGDTWKMKSREQVGQAATRDAALY
jgi:hypothetical protein